MTALLVPAPTATTSSVPTIPEMEHFSYVGQASLPSASTHIRLLELCPSGIDESSAPASGADRPDEDDSASSAHDSSPLVCTISTTPVATPRPFTALSYTWGRPDKTHRIEIAGAHIGITSSLDTALRHLRRRDEPVTLWIDQICINQEDPAEKGKQVPLMTQIYSKAQEVLVWLGPAADGSDALMDCWREVGQGARDLDIESYLTLERLPQLHQLMDNTNPSDPATVQFQALMARARTQFTALLEAIIAWNDRPWFGRVWIIQEQALGSNTVFLCGSKKVNLDLLPFATLIFDGCMGRQGTEDQNMELSQLVRKAQKRRFGPLMAARRRRRNFLKGAGPGDGLLSVLKKAYVDADAQATLARDRIYGLLSIAVDADQLDITPDYTRPECTHALTEAARALIRVGSVEVLSFSQFPKDLDGLPSWVPDWRPTLVHSYLAAFEDVNRLIICAAGSSTVEIEPTDDPRVLGIGGHVVDTIEETGDVWEWESGHQARAKHLDTIKTLCERSLANGCEIYESSERHAEAAWRVPVGDLYWTKKNRYQRTTPTDKSDYEDCINVLTTLAEMDALEPGQRHPGLEEFYRQIPGQSNYSENMDKMSGKRPYITRKGYVGMGPAGARPGDVVVILLGSRIPYVLRPSGDGTRYCFVGEAYCDGVMDGEILTKRQKEMLFIA